MRRITQEDLTVRDETGRVYPPRAVAAKLADTIVRTLGVVAALFVIAALWEALN